jgi:hypothetical protein
MDITITPLTIGAIRRIPWQASDIRKPRQDAARAEYFSTALQTAAAAGHDHRWIGC